MAGGLAGGLIGHAGGLVSAGGRAAAKVGGKILGKGLLKSALKKVPFLGLFAGLAFAGDRLMSGDFGGAALEALSGAASTFPGIGTAASIGLDAALAAKDIAAANAGPSTGASKASLATPVSTNTATSGIATAASSGNIRASDIPQPPGNTELLTSINDRMGKMIGELEMIRNASSSTAKSTKRSEPSPFGQNSVY